MISGQVCCGCLLVTFGFVCLTMLLLSGFRLMFGLWVGWIMFALGWLFWGWVVDFRGRVGGGLCSAWCIIARLIVFYMVFVGVGVSFVSFIVGFIWCCWAMTACVLLGCAVVL